MSKVDYQGVFTYPEWAIKNYSKEWIDNQDASREEQIKSVSNLYEIFPDSTIVYPGHSKFSDIGSEKKENKYVSLIGGIWSEK
jgi:2-keto-3-deoxy-galactonokinase